MRDPKARYQDFPDYYENDGLSVWDFTKEPTMAIKLHKSPRRQAQAVLDEFNRRKMSHTFRHPDVSYTVFKKEGCVVIDVDDFNYRFVYQYEVFRLYRSRQAGSNELVPTTLSGLVQPARGVLFEAMRDHIPWGNVLLGIERSDEGAIATQASALEARNAHFDQLERKQPEQPEQPEPAVPEHQPTAQPVAPPKKEVLKMSLIDVEKKVRKVVIEEVTSTIRIDKSRFVQLLKMAGAEGVGKNSTFHLERAGIELFADGDALVIETTTTTETETDS